MKESDIQIKVGHYMNSIIGTEKELTGGFETKVVRSGNFSLEQLEEQQMTALTNLSDRALYFKLSDMDIRKKPFDFFVLPSSYSYLVIYFMKSKLAYICLFVDILKRKRQTLSEDIIKEISVRIVKL